MSARGRPEASRYTHRVCAVGNGRTSIDILGGPDAYRDALMKAALDDPRDAAAAWCQWIGRHVERPLTPMARRWLPLIAWNLRSGVPAADASPLRESLRETWASNLRLIEAARPAVASLHAHGIRTIVLKGAALALGVYASLGLRAIGDVDILVTDEQADAAERILADLGWQPLRRRHPRDRRLVQAVDLRRPPDGALDLHWYLLRDCCWPGVDAGVWQRAVPLAAWPGAYMLGPADQLLHVCLHGLRWSPVHGGYWVADAARIIARAGPALDWKVMIEEARRRQLALQMREALDVVRERAHVDIPDEVQPALSARRAGWTERWEATLKSRPVVSAGGMFVIWAGWRRVRRGVKSAGATGPPWRRYLAAAIGVESSGALALRLARHARDRLVRAIVRRPRAAARIASR